MEFWGVEVKSGKPHKVTLDEGRIIHLSQATLGESKGKASDSVPLYVTFKGHKLVLGTLSSDKFPQIPFDLVFEQEFEVSHNLKNGSVYLIGYTAPSEDFGNPDDSDLSDDEVSEDEEIPLTAAGNGKPKPAAKPKAGAVKSAPAASQGVKAAEPKNDKKIEDDDEDESEDSGSDDDMEDGEGSDEEGSSDEDDEETPKKAASGKKRSNDSAVVTPVPSKKAKAAVAGAQKTDAKKGVHTATPHPAKQAGKTPASVKSPQSGGLTCKSCSKTFNTENALQSHSKAKHK